MNKLVIVGRLDVYEGAKIIDIYALADRYQRPATD